MDGVEGVEAKAEANEATETNETDEKRPCARLMSHGEFDLTCGVGGRCVLEDRSGTDRSARTIPDASFASPRILDFTLRALRAMLE